MIVEEIINMLFAKFPGVKILNIVGDDYVEFSINGNHRYSTRCGEAGPRTFEMVRDGSEWGYKDNAFSTHIEGVLAGKVRNAAGELVHA